MKKPFLYVLYAILCGFSSKLNFLFADVKTENRDVKILVKVPCPPSPLLVAIALFRRKEDTLCKMPLILNGKKRNERE